jgi:hypothetical protein
VLGQHRYRAPGDDGFTTSSLAQDRCAAPASAMGATADMVLTLSRVHAT